MYKRRWTMRLSGRAVVGAGWSIVAASAAYTPAQGQEAPAPAVTPVTDAMLRSASADGGKNWLMYGRDYTDQRWSPLAQITTLNVKNLRAAGMYQTGISRLGSFETKPVFLCG